MLECEIVSNSKRTIVGTKDFSYIYIPLSDNEKKLFAPSAINPCWRIKVDR